MREIGPRRATILVPERGAKAFRTSGGQKIQTNPQSCANLAGFQRLIL